MKIHLYALALLCLLTPWSSVGCGNDGQVVSGFDDETVDRLDAAVSEEMQGNDIPGVAVGVWMPGEGEYVVARGKANRESGEERDLDDPFRIGSITKTFTATAILQLVEEGKLSKSDRLSKWYPDFPNAEKITIEHLLRMQSGIADPDENPEQYDSPEEMIEASARLGGAFLPPGQRTEYTNVNYVILGEIVSKVSGNDTSDQIAHSILKPLGMENTTYPTDDDLPGDLRGYTYDFSTGELEDATSFNAAPAGGAGAMISNVSDLKTWAKALCSGKLLKPETHRAKLEAVPIEGLPDFVRYGEGIMQIGSFCGHAGGVPGFDSIMLYLAEEDATIIVNVNRSDPYAPPLAPALAEAVVEILLPKRAFQNSHDDLERMTALR
jgi:D-alanyl-D-alanine carboxypeptidase